MSVCREGRARHTPHHSAAAAAHANGHGRKTGITLADRGVYDEHGLEALSGIFSSPEKSPPRRSGTVTASESMDLQESTFNRATAQLQTSGATPSPAARCAVADFA